MRIYPSQSWEPHCRYKNTIRYSHSHSTAAATTRSRPPPSVYPPRICPIAAAPPPPLQVRPPPLLAFANPTDGGWRRRQRRKRPARKDVAFGPNCSRLSLNCGVLVPLCVRFIDAESTPPRRSHTKDNATVWSHANSIRSRGSDNFLRVCFLI